MSPCDNMKVCVLFFTILMSATGQDLYEDSIYKDAIQTVKDCETRPMTLCLKEKALNFIERLPNNIDIGNGIRIKQSDSGRLSREYTPITLPNETTEREAVLDKVLVNRIVDYLKSHTLELKFPMLGGMDNEGLVEEGRKEGGGYGGGYGGGGGGGKKGGKKGKGGMGLMMMMVYMKAATMYAVALKVIGAIAFKALLVAKVALTIAGMVALKKIIDGNKSHATYEVIAHPSHSDSHDRTYTFSPLDIVYKGYKPGA